MPTKVLAIDLIQVLGSVQPRATLNEDAIADYAEHYKPDAGVKLPPLRVFQQGEAYILSRGFHRYTAAQRAKRASLECEVLEGDERAAILDAMADNSEHGVRLTPADKRKAVNRLLDDPEWGKLPQKKVAEMANVSPRLVQMIVAERKPKLPPKEHDAQMRKLAESGETVEGQDGKEYPKTKPGVKGGIEAIAESDPLVLERRAAEAAKKADAAQPAAPSVNGAVKKPPKKTGTPAKQFDRSAYMKEWTRAIGPLVRLVDKIAKGVGETRSESHKTILEHLEIATEEMTEWMGVKKKK